MKDITILAAHCDDEIIFGWPVLQKAKAVICCSSDRHNPDRVWCKDRAKALREVCDLVGAKMVCLDHNSEFYRVNARVGELTALHVQVDQELAGLSHLIDGIKHIDSLLYTHNAWGEYGHLDHILVHQIAIASGLPVITSDMCAQAGWLNVIARPPEKKICDCDNDLAFYAACKAIYMKYGCWTWSQAPITRCGLYENN